MRSPPGALIRKPYLMRLLFTHNNGDFGAISVTKRSCGAPTSEVERHISDRVRTVIRTVVKVNNYERGLEPTEKEEKFQEW